MSNSNISVPSIVPSNVPVPSKHITQVLKRVDYSKLVNLGYIPSFPINLDVKTVKFPYFVYSETSFCEYGMFMDYLVRRMISDFPNVKTTKAYDPVAYIMGSMQQTQQIDYAYYEAYQKYTSQEIPWTSAIYSSYLLSSLHFGKQIYTKQDINKKFMSYKYTFNDLQRLWQSYGLSDVWYNQEFIYLGLQIHPDCICKINAKCSECGLLNVCQTKGKECIRQTSYCILDIKCTQSFKGIKESSLLQIISYACVCNELYLQGKCPFKIEFVGIILVMQHDIMLFDIKPNFNHKVFLDYLVNLS